MCPGGAIGRGTGERITHALIFFFWRSTSRNLPVIAYGAGTFGSMPGKNPKRAILPALRRAEAEGRLCVVLINEAYTSQVRKNEKKSLATSLLTLFFSFFLRCAHFAKSARCNL